MKNEKLFSAIGNIDDSLISEAVNDAKRSNMKVLYKGLAMVASLAIILMSALVITLVGTSPVSAVVALDVNPSIEIEINKDEAVLSVNSLNGDASDILGDITFENTDLETTVNAIIDAMLKNGYLSAEKNSILISVDAKSSKKAENLKKQISDKIAEKLGETDIEASIMTQNFKKGKKDNKKGVSPAKAALLAKVESTILDAEGNPYTFEQLAAMNINELKALLESKSVDVEGIVSSGVASETSYIGKDKALSVALENAGVTKENVVGLRFEMDFEDGVMLYEIKFLTEDKKYEYEINAKTGEIVEVKSEEKSEKAEKPKKEDKKPTQIHEFISKEDALTAALAAAEVDAANVTESECELEFERGKAYYEVEFKTAEAEYEYKIDAVTGKVIENEKEHFGRPGKEEGKKEDADCTSKPEKPQKGEENKNVTSAPENTEDSENTENTKDTESQEPTTSKPAAPEQTKPAPEGNKNQFQQGGQNGEGNHHNAPAKR